MLAAVIALGLLQSNPIAPGAVSGQLRTVDGVPAVNVRVVVTAVPPGNGLPGQSPNYFDLAAPTDRTLTDNQGKFRLQEIVPGRYYLLAGAAPQGTYYPDAGDIRGATILSIEPGVELDSLNFQLLDRLGGSVSGRVNADMKTLGPRTATIVGGTLEELLEVDVSSEGTFEFGHVPPGKYLLSLYPPTPGIASMPVTVGDADISGLELVPLPTKKVTGRIIVKNGSIPHGILGFYTEKTYVGGNINPDGTFSVELHSATHQIDFAGLPVGYSLASVRVASEAAPAGIVVRNADVSDVLVTVNAPTRLAVVRGKISGLPQDRFSSTVVEMAGPTFNRLQADVQPDATFEFPAVVPGLYRLTLGGVPQLAPVTVIVDSFRTFDVSVAVPSP